MRVSLKGFRLDPAGAERLKVLLSGERSNACAQAVIHHVISLGAKHAIVEDPYTDRDYSSDYQNFYAAAFRDYPRHTRRVHLFAEDVTPLLSKPLAEQHDALQQAEYLGFIVIRPIAQGPIGRTVLRFPDLGPDLVVRKAARADFKAHLLGSILEVGSAAPFIQQDERIGSCAQASIWMATRPVHERHRRTPWHSIAEITRLATTPTDEVLSRSLPAGSGGLNPIHIIRALRGMGHQPLFDFFAETPKPKGRAKAKAKPVPTLAAAAAAVRYLDSGLPVIIALADLGEKLGHAITAVGFVEARGGLCRTGSTYDSFVRALIVHDDQRGPYRLMPLSAEDVPHLPADRLLRQGETVLTVADAVTHMFVPLPLRVFLPADRADTVVRDFLEQYVKIAGKGMRARIVAQHPDADTAIGEFYDLVTSGRLVRRTYLTSAGRYRHHLAKSDLADEIKAELLVRSLPHFVWVTELISPDAPGCEDGGARTVIGHMVVNATSSTDPSSDLLVAHLPHVLVHRDVNPPADKGEEFIETAVILEDHAPYRGRRRS
jgi:hypothetical protein